MQICRPWITLKNGKRLYAAKYGKKAFCFKADEERPKQEVETKELPLEKVAD